MPNVLIGSIEEDQKLEGVIQQYNLGGNLGFTVKEIYIDGGPKWQVQFTDDIWVAGEGRFYLDVPMSTHGLGLLASIRTIERLVESTYENVWYAYKRYSNGTLRLYADERYSGRLILEGGT